MKPKPNTQLIETIDSLPNTAISSAISRCPVFYGKDAKSSLFVNSLRNEFIQFLRGTKEISSSQWTEAWRAFATHKGNQQLSTLGRDFASKKERDMVKNSIERYINESISTSEATMIV